MARSDAVWGIDVGQCALKALRCRPHEKPDRLIADAFDYIEYPKILSQPGAEPDELVAEALKQFLSRNSVKGDRVAISVSGQAGLARFIKLPPVESKKIPDIVRYEARQQIPFDLNDVIWDYQRMGGGAEEEGFALETEIGLFAIKRDTVFRALEPFQRAGVEVDYVQLSPLSLYNFVRFDILTELPPPEEYDPENPPGSVAVISVGTDQTDLVVTNGFRVWQRNIPLGGNHFTRALTKELKLTFAKAEHLKRNAAAAQDPKAVFQAMRPVFNDLLTELQRSIGYFSSLDRSASIDKIVALGNAMKLPGLRRYLSQNLGFEIERVEKFRGLTGNQVLSAPAFKDNTLSFGPCYGLAVQGLGRAGLRTNLLPKEIVKDRLIRQKKPWAVAAAAALLLGAAVSFASHSLALGTVDADSWQGAESQAASVASTSQRLQEEKTQALEEFARINTIGEHLTQTVEGRILWLELLSVLNQCLPQQPAPTGAAAPAAAQPAEAAAAEQSDPKAMAKKIMERDAVQITTLEAQHYDEMAAWFAGVQKWYKPTKEELDQAAGGGQAAGAPADAGFDPTGAAAGVPAAAAPDAGMTGAGMPDSGMAGVGVPGMEGAAPSLGPQGPGWVITITAHHYHNEKTPGNVIGAEYIRRHLIQKLHDTKVLLPTGVDADKDGKPDAALVSMKEFGISYPVMVGDPKAIYSERIQIPSFGGAGGGGASDVAGGARRGVEETEPLILPRFDFVVQFCWQPTSPSQRLENKEKQQQADQGQAALP